MWNTAHMKESYNQRKSLIRNSLLNIDSKPNNKIVFDENVHQPRESNKRKYNYDSKGQNNKRGKYDLFDQDDKEQDEINFQVKNQFEGKKGQKLLELQSKFATDKRFNLDSRFLEENDEETYQDQVDDEKQNEWNILESVLGTKLRKNGEAIDNNRKHPKRMLRFDPSKPEHSKFEVKEMKNSSKEDITDTVIIDIEPPVEVSKETFYKVTGNLKESLKQNEGFSLLSMFGTAEAKDIETDEKPQEITKHKTNIMEQNPFRYDSSDTEDDNEKKGHNGEKTMKSKEKLVHNSKILRGENFFFKEGDERLNDGFNFLTKFRTGEKSENFSVTRREVKRIMREKVKKMQRNNRPFQKKFGQNKRIKLKRAKKS